MNIMVSVLTTAYNHAPYIAQTIESIISQETNFHFELIIHDDASTDGTADIIRAYAEKYPDIIHPIFQTENQYSQGVDVYSFMNHWIHGKYVAQCEGDDYWCDIHKLQKQVDYMEMHPECSYCFCNSYNVNLDSEVVGTQTPSEEDRVFLSKEIVAAPEVFLATAGVLFRYKDYISYPDELSHGLSTDVTFRNYLMTLGNAFCHADRMVCYRVMTPGSWSEWYAEGIKNNNESFIQMNKAYIQDYLDFDSYSKGIFHEELQEKLNDRLYLDYFMTNNWKELHKLPFWERFQKVSPKIRRIIFIKSHFPHIVQLFRLFRYGKEGLEKRY